MRPEQRGARREAGFVSSRSSKNKKSFHLFPSLYLFKMLDNIISLFLFDLLFLFLSLVTSNFCWTFPPNKKPVADGLGISGTFSSFPPHIGSQLPKCVTPGVMVSGAASDWLRVSALDSDWLMMGWWGMSRACHDRVNVTRTWNLRAWCLGTPGMQASDIASPRTTSRLSNLYHIIWKCFRE